MRFILNKRTIANLDEVMKITNQTNPVHVLNLMVSAFLESLKKDAVKEGGAQCI